MEADVPPSMIFLLLALFVCLFLPAPTLLSLGFWRAVRSLSLRPAKLNALCLFLFCGLRPHVTLASDLRFCSYLKVHICVICSLTAGMFTLHRSRGCISFPLTHRFAVGVAPSLPLYITPSGFPPALPPAPRARALRCSTAWGVMVFSSSHQIIADALPARP